MSSYDRQVRRRGVRPSRFARNGIRHLLLLLGCAAMLVPLVQTVLTSLKYQSDIFSWPPTLFPERWNFGSYAELFRVVPFWLWTRNSVVITVLATLGAVLSSTLAGFAFARLRFRGRDLLFMVCVATMMLPGIVMLVPTFVLFRGLGWIDTILPLVVPSWLGVPFYIFLSRQYFRGIPREYEEAARVDGANNWYIWAIIMLPMAKPLVITLVIFSVISNWNEFLQPLIYLNSIESQTLAVGLRSLQNFYNTRWDLIMAGASLMTAPMMLLFFLAQRYFMEGRTALTGLGGR